MAHVVCICTVCLLTIWLRSVPQYRLLYSGYLNDFWIKHLLVVGPLFATFVRHNLPRVSRASSNFPAVFAAPSLANQRLGATATASSTSSTTSFFLLDIRLFQC